MAKAVKNARKKNKQEEELLEVETVDTDEEETEEVDTDEEVDTEENEDEAGDDEDTEADEAEVQVADVTDEFKQVKVLVLQDVPRFLIGTEYVDELTEGHNVKLPFYVASHLQERGRVKIV